MVEYQKQKKRDVGVILRWRKSPPPNQGLTYGETSLSAKGSSPAWRANASVAQLVEQLICTQLVEGSTPFRSSK